MPQPGRSGAAERETPASQDVFVESLRELKAEPIAVKTREETVETLRRIVKGVSPSLTVLAGLPTEVGQLVKGALSSSFVVAEELRPSEALAVLQKADLGITWAEYGVADTGALVEIAYDDTLRLASSLPINHIAIVSASMIIPDLRHAMAEAGDKVSRSVPGRKPVVTFISGPSRTADIEGRLLLGAHGPYSVFVVVLGWK
jgi:L-lactate dehydrogenase complex protein LldG